jgi:hypothetical protein
VTEEVTLNQSIDGVNITHFIIYGSGALLATKPIQPIHKVIYLLLTLRVLDERA